jgi:hypothetical protein
VAPPEGEVTILFSDITRAASLWEFNATAMKEATLLHNQLLRSLLKEHQVLLLLLSSIHFLLFYIL